MKDKALYHLLMTSARSVASMYPVYAAEILANSTSLKIERTPRSPFLLSWVVATGETKSVSIESNRFVFYSRGDIASSVNRRTASFDLRDRNWIEAHRVWGAILGLPQLESLTVTPSRAMPVAHRSARHESVAPLVVTFGATAAAVIAASGGFPGLTLGALCAIAPFLGYRVHAALKPSAMIWLLGCLIALVTSNVVESVSDDALRSLAAGTAALLLATELGVSRVTRRDTFQHVMCAFGLALAMAVAPIAFAAAAVILILVDVVFAHLRRESIRARNLLSGLVGSVGLSLILDSVLAERFALEMTGGGDSLIIASLIAIVACGGAVFGATHGVRDRVSGWLSCFIGPPVFVWASYRADYESASTIPLAAICAVVLARHLATGLLRWNGRIAISSTPNNEPLRIPVFVPLAKPIDDVPKPVAVQISRRP
jgi:hypothetical protein